MELYIKNRNYTWQSNFLTEVNKQGQSKWSKKREDYFCVEKIGGVRCFIKRSEVGFEGASIFSKLVGASSVSIPQTYGFSESIEHNKRVQYLITEYIPGETLDVVLNSGKKIKELSFTTDIIAGIEYLSSIGYWHTDLNADNIYIADTGRSYIIDIDSCVEHKYKPTHIPTSVGGLTTLSNQLGSYALKYYKEHLGKGRTFNYSGIPGVNLNYYQLLFLSYQLKYFQHQKKSDNSVYWKKSTFKGIDITEGLRRVNSKYADSVFKAGLVKPLNDKIVLNLAKQINHNSINPAIRISRSKKANFTPQSSVSTSKLLPIAKQKPNKSKKKTPQSKKLTNQLPSPANTTNNSVEDRTILGWSIAAVTVILFGLFLYICSTSGVKESSSTNGGTITPSQYVQAITEEEITVERFFNNINSGNYVKAYSLSNNPKWQPLPTFKSSVGWGGFRDIKLVKSKLINRKLLTYFIANDINKSIKVHRLNGFTFDDNNKINKLVYFPIEEINHVRRAAEIGTVKQFYRYIQDRQFRKAHYFTLNPVWGDVDYFASPKTGWGGIEKFDVIRVVESGQCREGHDVVYVEYREQDPYNNNYGTKQMYYHLELKNQEFKIVRATMSKYGDSK